MPLFMEVHDMVDELTFEAVADAHQRDLQVQHGVTHLTNWIDESSGKLFCLVEAYSQEEAEAVHRQAHGSLAMVQIRPRQLDGSDTGGSNET